MANPLDSVKQLWADPKKRPYLIAAGGGVGAAGLLAMRRGSAEEEGAETAAVDAGEDVPIDPATGLPVDTGLEGQLPIVVSGGGGGGYDGMSETDLSGVWDELSLIGDEQQANLDAALERERRARRRLGGRIGKAEDKLARQRKQTQKLRRRLRRLDTRRKRKKKSRRPGNRGATPRGRPVNMRRARRERIRRPT